MHVMELDQIKGGCLKAMDVDGNIILKWIIHK